MQQGAGSQSQCTEMTPATTTMGQQPVESASPISSRPPSNMDELIRLSSGGGDEDAEGDRAGGLASGNRWPRQETLALLKIRSDMDAAFRDATIKGPLWEDISRYHMIIIIITRNLYILIKIFLPASGPEISLCTQNTNARTCLDDIKASFPSFYEWPRSAACILSNPLSPPSIFILFLIYISIY